MSSMDALKTLFETEANPGPLKVGGALAEYCRDRGSAADDNQVLSLLRNNGFRGSFGMAAHINFPLKGDSGAERQTSLIIDQVQKCLQIHARVSESYIHQLEIKSP